MKYHNTILTASFQLSMCVTTVYEYTEDTCSCTNMVFICSKIEIYIVTFFTGPLVVDPCSQLKCNGQGERCVEVDSHKKKTDQPFAECQCVTAREHCSRGITVCGSDNKHYKSSCHMDAEACATKKKIWAVSYLECARSSKYLYNVLVYNHEFIIL